MGTQAVSLNDRFDLEKTPVLLNGTLNRVMIVELGTPSWIIALLIALPLVAAPFRALIGHNSANRVVPFGLASPPSQT